MRWLALLVLFWGCGKMGGSYVHVIETSGGLMTPRLDCVQPRITLVGPDGIAWRSVVVTNVELLPAYDCGLGGGDSQEDSPGGLQ